MGAHGPAELLIHILDPNRVVEPNFISQTIDTRDDLNYSGIIERENEREVFLRNANGDYTIQQKDIKTRRSSELSLMPEGFEQLGHENLRDLLTFLGSEEQRYRVVDLRPAFTADSTKGIYSTRESTSESLVFRHFGMVKVAGIPFDIVSPQKSLNGNNVVVLRGRNGLARDYPRRVEVSGLNLTASRLHFLGGVGGWAWPSGGDDARGLPAATIIVTYADRNTESWSLINGVDLADYAGAADVPGSKLAAGLLDHGQIRFFTRTLSRKSPVTRITLESMSNQVAPTFVAITAESDSEIKAASQSK
jgi:putative heme-binding domain-containing protein